MTVSTGQISAPGKPESRPIKTACTNSQAHPFGSPLENTQAGGNCVVSTPGKEGTAGGSAQSPISR